jgi:hypothetical protein
MTSKINFIVFLLFISCTRKETIDDARSMNDPGVPISELEDKALNDGDTAAFDLLVTSYLDYAQGEFLPIAKKMAKKHNYSRAYFEVYEQLLEPSDNGMSLENCDEHTREIALDYLKIAYDLHYHQAISELAYLYEAGKFIKKDTSLSRKLKIEYDSLMEYYRLEIQKRK